MSTIEQVLDNARTFEKFDPLSETEKKALRDAAAVFIKDLGVPCSACRYCCDTCPAKLDIPLLIQGYNEKNISGSTWKIGNLAGAKSASECIGCGTCLFRCPQKINIPEIMQKIAAT